LLIYHLGGGLFDVSIIRIKKERITLLGSDGDVNLGCNLVDKRLAYFFCDLFGEERGFNPRQQKGHDLNKIRLAVQKAKNKLSTRDHAGVRIECAGKISNYTLTRKQLEIHSDDLLAQTKAMLSLII
jgi:molecular chaperone DnaK (HSP70)